MSSPTFLKRKISFRQSFLAFESKSRKRDRRFKQAILATTSVLILLLLTVPPRIRRLTASLPEKVGRQVRKAVGFKASREEIDTSLLHSRQQGIEDTAREFRRIFDQMEPSLQRLMRYAGNDPETGLLRWGNFNSTLLLPSSVFEPDDTGRSYRLRPLTRSIWLRNITLKGAPLTFFLVPEGPDLLDVIKGTAAVIVPDSVQTTNSWGLRGPQPDPSAPIRGIVLGDSFMQGMFVADDRTPSECLRRELEKALATRVSILNTGVLGYSPEQYFHSLRAYADRFDPQFVVLSVFANDFGELYEVLRGEGEWEEGRYWLGEIIRFCRGRGILCLTVPVTTGERLTGRRHSGHFPGQVSNILESSSLEYLDPIEAFVNRNFQLVLEGERKGNRPATSPLMNGQIGDGHFSPIGCQVWGEAVSGRLILLLDRDRARLRTKE